MPFNTTYIYCINFNDFELKIRFAVKTIYYLDSSYFINIYISSEFFHDTIDFSIDNGQS